MRKLFVLLLVVALSSAFAGVALAQTPACSDDIDNDNDGFIDFDGGPNGEPPDPGCESPGDFHEEPVNHPPDGDGNSCRASVVRIEGQGLLSFLGTIEPFVANEQDVPCEDDQAGILGLGTFIPIAGGGVGLTLLDAETFEGGPAAFSSVLLVTIFAPFTGDFLVGAAVLTSGAFASCPDGDFFAGSEVVFVQTALTPPVAVTNPTQIALGPLGTLYLNRTINEPNQITQQALFLDTPVVDITIAESQVDCSEGGDGHDGHAAA